MTASDSGGFIHDPDGIDDEKLAWLKDLKEVRRGRISEYAEQFGASTTRAARPGACPADLALPCATQNELDADDGADAGRQRRVAVAEGANMPTTLEGCTFS